MWNNVYKSNIMSYAPVEKTKELERVIYSDHDLAKMHVEMRAFMSPNGDIDKNAWLISTGAITKTGAVVVKVIERNGNRIKSCKRALYEEVLNKWGQYMDYLGRKQFGDKKRFEAYKDMPEAQ